MNRGVPYSSETANRDVKPKRIAVLSVRCEVDCAMLVSRLCERRRLPTRKTREGLFDSSEDKASDERDQGET